ncbi:MAG: CoA transferase subunit A [Acidimicrobiales bacterium]
MRKVYETAAEAVADISTGATLAVGGFGLSGIPETLIKALAETDASDLRVVSNNCGTDEHGLGILLNAGKISKMTSSYIGENAEFARQYLGGELEVELCPQGTIAERLRAGGCGIPAFYTPTGVGTLVGDGGLPLRYGAGGSIAKGSEPRESREFGGRTYVLEHAIVVDFALVHALRADESGNLVFRQSSRNFNPLVAMAGKVTIVEAEEIFPVGGLDPDLVHLPGLFVQRIVRVPADTQKTIEKLTVRARKGAAA